VTEGTDRTDKLAQEIGVKIAFATDRLFGAKNVATQLSLPSNLKELLINSLLVIPAHAGIQRMQRYGFRHAPE